MAFNPFDSIKESLTRKVLAGWLRDAAKIAGLWLVKNGVMDSDDATMNQFIELSVGAVMFGFAMYQSYAAKRLADKAVDVAVEAPAGTPKPVIEAIAKQELKK